ncbi:hypothetical protein [Methanocella sp. MCL-LM]|uniref:hypothetical protein n=1 Tax=Methanocella sp. MCL-LM TaxID=3412035 RepID=UPI003C77B7C5
MVPETWKRGMGITILLLLIVSAAGCFGGTPPDFRNETEKYDLAVQQYNNAKTLYHQGNYSVAKTEFSAVIKHFQDNKSVFETISKGNYTSKEVYLSKKLVNNADQYTYAAAFYRDVADAAARGDTKQAYAIELNAEEFDQASRLTYEDIRNELLPYLHSRK